MQALTSHHIHPLQWAMAASAVLTTLAAQLGHDTVYALCKPLTMLIALACVALVARRSPCPRSFRLLIAGLLLSMVGDVFLLDMAHFVPGLLAFLLAHICYIALFGRDAPWLAHQAGLALCFIAGAAVYAFLQHRGLPPPMQLPVAAYVLVIALMGAQAIGRAHVLRTAAARTVAWGAVSFMLSDTVLAVNQFAFPVPYSFVWVLGSYYIAQWLIVHGMLQTLRNTPSKK